MSPGCRSREGLFGIGHAAGALSPAPQGLGGAFI
jgi:hypothetical protein